MGTITTAFRGAYNLAFQVSPIILNGGLAASASGGMLPIIALAGEVAALAQSALLGGANATQFFATFVPVPGGRIISNAVGMYPFANQQVAANAIIEQPLNISLRMIAPVNSSGGYLSKLALFTSIRNSLRDHNNAGGTYHIATPSFLYTNCIMVAMTDVTGGDTKQQQIEWQLDFLKPLITQEDAASAFNGLMSKLTGGGQVTGSSWSGALAAQGAPLQGAVSGINQLAGAVNSYSTGS